MTGDSNETLAERTYTLLHWILASNMPRPGGVHIYSTGNMYNNFVTRKTANGWQMIMSEGVAYSEAAMGYLADGTRRTARGPLEEINFKTIPNALNRISLFIGGK